MFTKLTSFIIAIIMFFAPAANYPAVDVKTDEFKTNYTYVFVHGLGGWGEYGLADKFLPYWGTMGGSLMKYLNARGFDTVAASVDPMGSCWDRACELYAELTGTRVDYGKAHSEANNHKRFGQDFTGRALIKEWDSEHKINLLGHSFGGATILQFTELVANGSKDEIAATDKNDISPLFLGGNADTIYSITTLSAPINGTSAYYIKDEIDADPNANLDERIVSTAVGALAGSKPGKIAKTDCAGADMEIDRAMSLCESWETLQNVYYFSFATDVTTVDENGNRTIDPKDMEIVYRGGGPRMLVWRGTTASGFVVDDSWASNDGLVNTISARAPFNAPQCEFDQNNISSGIWNKMPVMKGDHMSLQGGLLINNPVRELYVNHLTMINTL